MLPSPFSEAVGEEHRRQQKAVGPRPATCVHTHMFRAGLETYKPNTHALKSATLPHKSRPTKPVDKRVSRQYLSNSTFSRLTKGAKK